MVHEIFLALKKNKRILEIKSYKYLCNYDFRILILGPINGDQVYVLFGLVWLCFMA